MARGGGPPDASVGRGGSPPEGEDLARNLVLDAPWVSDGEDQLVVVSLDTPLPSAASPMEEGNGTANGNGHANGHANDGHTNGDHHGELQGFERLPHKPGLPTRASNESPTTSCTASFEALVHGTNTPLDDHSGSNGSSLLPNGTSNGTRANGDHNLEVAGSTPLASPLMENGQELVSDTESSTGVPKRAPPKRAQAKNRGPASVTPREDSPDGRSASSPQPLQPAGRVDDFLKRPTSFHTSSTLLVTSMKNMPEVEPAPAAFEPPAIRKPKQILRGDTYGALNIPFQNNKKKKNFKSILKAPKEVREAEVGGPLPGAINDIRFGGSRKTLAMAFLAPRKTVRFDMSHERKNMFVLQLPPILPESEPAVQWWRSLFIIPLAYETWAFPFRFALGSPPRGQNAHGMPVDTTLFFVDMACDVWVMLDGFSHCFIQVPGRTHFTRWQLGALYLRETFTVELLPSIVYYIVILNSDNLWLYWVFSIGRFNPRFRRLRAYFQKMEMNLEVQIENLQIIKFTLVIFCSCHSVGCIFYWMARLQNFAPNTWVGQFQITMPGVFHVEDSPVAEHYLAILYRGWIGLAPNSYRMPPQNWPEQIFSVSVMFMAMYLSAYLLGSVMPYIVKKDPIAEAFQKRKSDFVVFASQRALPHDLIAKVLAYYEFQNQRKVMAGNSSIQLTRTLQTKVSNRKYRPYIERNVQRGQVLFKCEQAFLSAIVAKLRELYLMPGEEFIRYGDVARALFFVMDGVVQLMNDDVVKKEVRGDVADMACIVGETSFFLGVAQRESARASASGNVTLLVLDMTDADKIFSQFPEQQDMVMGNVLSMFNLDMLGNNLTGGFAEDDSDVAAEEQRNTIIHALKRRNSELFSTLSFASSMGEIDTVRRAIRKGADANAKNYDQRTLLHMACEEGNTRIVEMLLEQGADKNMKSRWGITPLMEAIYAKQNHVVEILLAANAQMLLDDPGGILCDYASQGDVDNLKLLLNNRVDPNVGDYDRRTALHLASSEGHDKVVEMLINSNADVNCKDRWGGTPLQDAVVQSRSAVAERLRQAGAMMPHEIGSSEFCASAADGDVAKLRMLHSCGVDPDDGDYDRRAPMHVAAAGARVLVISFLLGVSAGVNVLDRWGATPLDDCLRGGTLYHVMCGKLIRGWGGDFGVVKGTPEALAFIEECDRLDMADVSALIKRLIRSGLYNKRIASLSESESMVCFESNMRLVELYGKVRDDFQAPAEFLSDLIKRQRSVQDQIKNSLFALAKAADLAPAHLSVVAAIEDHDRMKHGRGGSQRHLQGLESDDKSQERRGGEFARVRTYVRDLVVADLNQDSLLEEIISDEMLLLYDELDLIIRENNKFEAYDRVAQEAAAKALNRQLMQLSDVEVMYELLVELTKECYLEAYPEARLEGLGMENHVSEILTNGITPELLRDLLDKAGLEHIEDEEARAMWEEALPDELKVCSIEELEDRMGYLDITVDDLLAKSPAFRKALLSMDGSGMVEGRQEFTRIYNTPGLRDFPFFWIREKAMELSPRAVRKGAKLLSQGQPALKLILMLKGSVKREAKIPGESDLIQRSVLNGEVAIGAAQFFTGEQLPYSVIAIEACEVIEIGIEQVVEAVRIWPSLVCNIARGIAASMEEGLGEGETEFMNKFSQNGVFNNSAIAGLSSQIAQYVEWQISQDDPDHSLSLPFGDGFGDGMQGVRDLHPLVKGARIVQDAWEIYAQGADEIPVFYLDGVSELLGEVGTRFFEAAFDSILEQYKLREQQEKKRALAAGPDDPGAQEKHLAITVNLWWACWTAFVAGLTSPTQSKKQSGSILPAEDHEESRKFVPPTIVEVFMSYLPWGPGRITSMLLSPEIQDRYEAVYIVVKDDLGTPLNVNEVAIFLRKLLPDTNISRVHVYEWLQLFGQEGREMEPMRWLHMKKVLREQVRQTTEGEPLFIKSTWVLNPRCVYFETYWYRIVKIVALYHFFMVPVRLTFSPFARMDQTELLSTDLIADCILFIFAALRWNTAYFSKKSRWVTSRGKIAKHYLANGFVTDALCSFPFDWLVMFGGFTMATAQWLRLSKMTAIRFVMVGIGGRSSDLNGIYRLFLMAMMILHISACLWVALGRSSDMDFALGTSWLTASSAAKFLEGVHPEEGNTLLDWEVYTISLNWVATHTVSSIGNTTLYPKNYIEVIFAIVQLTIGMTFYRMVLGQISTRVMKKDEKTIKTRSELSALDSYIVSNGLTDEPQIANEIRRNFHAMHSMSTVDFSEIFDNLNFTLQFTMAKLLTREALDHAELFRGCSEQFLDSLSLALREVVFAPEEFIVQTGDPSDEMFIVISGHVLKLIDSPETGGEMPAGDIGKGGVVGDVSFAFGMKHIYTAHASSSTGATCLRLYRSAYLQILKLFPEDEDSVAANSLVCFDKAKTEHGASDAGSRKSGAKKKTKEEVANDQQELAAEEKKETEVVDDKSMGTDGSDGENSEDGSQKFEAIVGSGVSSHIQQLKARQAAGRVMQLLEASYHNELPRIKKLLARGVSVNDADPQRRTALHVAASEGHIEAVRYLLENGADISIKDAQQNTALNDSVRSKHDEVSDLIQSFGRGHGISLPGVQASVQLCQAAFDGDMVCLKRLINYGTAIDACDYDGRTALHLASCEGHLEMVNWLIEQKCNVNAKDRFNGSALQDAVRHGHEGVQKALSLAGAPIAGDSTAVTICELAKDGNIAQIRTLVENGVDPLIPDYDKRTALHLAASEGRVEVLNYFLNIEPKLYLNPIDITGGTPLDDAYRHNQLVSQTMLEMAGAMRASDPRLKETDELFTRESNRKTKLLRDPTVQTKVEASKEQMYHSVIAESSKELVAAAEKHSTGVMSMSRTSSSDDVSADINAALSALSLKGDMDQGKSGDVMAGIEGNAGTNHKQLLKACLILASCHQQVATLSAQLQAVVANFLDGREEPSGEIVEKKGSAAPVVQRRRGESPQRRGDSPTRVRISTTVMPAPPPGSRAPAPSFQHRASTRQMVVAPQGQGAHPLPKVGASAPQGTARQRRGSVQMAVAVGMPGEPIAIILNQLLSEIDKVVQDTTSLFFLLPDFSNAPKLYILALRDVTAHIIALKGEILMTMALSHYLRGYIQRVQGSRLD